MYEKNWILLKWCASVSSIVFATVNRLLKFYSSWGNYFFILSVSISNYSNYNISIIFIFYYRELSHLLPRYRSLHWSPRVLQSRLVLVCCLGTLAAIRRILFSLFVVWCHLGTYTLIMCVSVFFWSCSVTCSILSLMYLDSSTLFSYPSCTSRPTPKVAFPFLFFPL